jgi:hypothetical protein
MNEINPNVERNKRLEEFFQKVEDLLTENFEVIGKLLVLKIKEDGEIENEHVS